MRYNSNGTLDTGFGNGGKVTNLIGGYSGYGASVALQGDGKIVVAGSSGTAFALARYNSDGTLDTGFGSGGSVTTSIGIVAIGKSLTLQSDGKIVLAGQAIVIGYGWNFALVRYNSNGTLDTSFGSGGKVTTPFGNGSDVGNSVVLQLDGRIVVAGWSSNGSNDDFALVRYNTNGTLDTSFGSGGMVTTPIGGGSDVGISVALQGDGRIVVAGSSYNGSNNDFAVVRYLGDSPTGQFTWPAQNGYAHPLSKTTTAIRSPTSAQFLSSQYESNWPARHVGIDLEKSDGTSADGDPVYAIDDGEIVYFRRQLSGDGFYPAIFVRHFTATGTPFWAIYGHCNLLNTIRPRPSQLMPPDQEEVSLDASPIAIIKGRQIGTIITAGEPHLHLGINTSTSYGSFFTGSYGWGRVPSGITGPYTTDTYIFGTLKWWVPIDQDSPVSLGFLNDLANSNNAPEQFTNWQTKSFTGTTVAPAQQLPDADAAGDGISNRLKYALGLNPLSGTGEGRPKIELISSGGFSFPGFKYQRRKNATDLIYKVSTSDDLVIWDSTGIPVVQFGLPEACPDGDCELVTFRLSPYLPTALKKFFSVQIFQGP